MPKPELTLVSISGAQATGKTTLLNALATSASFHAALCENSANATTVAMAVTPSFGSRLFERWQKRQLPSAPIPVADYDQIDKRGHREWFQRQLPDALSFEVELAAQHLRSRTHAVNVMLVDRWFPDIMSHTRIGLPKDTIAHRQIRDLCRARYQQLMRDLCLTFSLAHVTVFVPVAASTFAVQGQEGKFRATVDRQEFERLCLEEWPAILDRQPTVTISSSSLDARVLDIETATKRVRVSHGKEATTQS